MTTFPVPGGQWKWSITRSALEGPIYARQAFDSESDARAAAWHALCGWPSAPRGQRRD